jgi:multicomponent Na+:H+ antiporter subunit D
VDRRRADRFAVVYGRAGALNLAQIGRALEHGPLDLPVAIGFALIAVGLLVKAAIVPFHFWTADAYAVAPTPICILLAGAFSELGLYGLFRVYWTAFHGVLGGEEEALRAIFVAAGAMTAAVGAGMCLVQHHLKRMLAFATISQVGLYLVGLGLLTPGGVAGAAVWVVADGLVKAALFAIAGVLQHRCDRVTEHELHGGGRGIWPLGAAMALAALMIASLPPTGSFLGRSLVEDAALEVGGYGWVPVFMAVVTAVVAGTLLRAAGRVFGGWGIPAGPDPQNEDGDTVDEESRDRRTGAVLWVPAVVLLAGAAAWGVLPGLTAGVARAAGAFTDTSGYASAVLGGAHHAVPAVHLKAPGTTAYLYALLSLAGALGVAALGLAGAGGRVPRGVAAAVAGVRRLHDGRPTDYVTWLAAGAAVLCAAFALGVG